MLIRYDFWNFRSFKDRVTLSMKAGSEISLCENLIRSAKLRILPSAAIYGANASGKTNIALSINVLRSIIVKGVLDAEVAVALMPFLHGDREEPTGFEIEFKHKRKRFIYKVEVFSIFHKKGKNPRIFTEKLSMMHEKEYIWLFHRTDGKIRINPSEKALRLTGNSLSFIKSIEAKANENTDVNELFLSRGFKSMVSGAIADYVVGYMQNCIIPISDFFSMQISYDINSKTKTTTKWNAIVERFIRAADFGPQKIVLRKESTDEDANARLYSHYKLSEKKAIGIPSEIIESNGTLELIKFATMFDTHFKNDVLFVLDEFDAAIHHELVMGILAAFNDPDVNKSGSQLIFTTHNPVYINKRVMRRDQIRFVEKNLDTFDSKIYSLADIEGVHKNHNYMEQYLKGKYSALPYYDFARFLRGEDG